MRYTAVVLCFSALIACAAALSCMNPRGAPVDWWIMLKFPEISNSTIPVYQQGYGYMYMDADTPEFDFSNVGLNAAQDALAATLKPIYAGANSVWLMYNDEGGTKTNTSRSGSDDDVFSGTDGHTKGVVQYDQNGGYWLVHSVPRFPAGSGDYSFPEDERIYGQSFLCMSLNVAHLATVGVALQYNSPYIYAHKLPSTMVNVCPTISDAINGQRMTAAGKLVKQITTIKGTPFTVFAKNGAWNGELYEGLVAPTFSTNLLVETWIRSPPLGSFCKPQYAWQVLNVKRVWASDEASWNETQDHAKWAVSDGGSITCIGDINRMSSQAARGGGTVCMTIPGVHSQFRDLIQVTEPCT